MKDVKRRNTRQRAVVYNVLRHTRSHPDAEWIYKEARKIIPNLSLGTIYRNLKILKEQRYKGYCMEEGTLIQMFLYASL